MRRFLKTVGFYLLVGPPLGLLAMLVAMLLGDTSVDTVGAMEGTWNVISTIPLMVPFAYLFGGAQAALTGVCAALWEKIRGSVPILVPVVAAAVIWVGSVGLLDEQGGGLTSGSGLIFLAAHLAAAAGSWWLLRRVRKENIPSGNQPQ